jgi:hypothetical protein
VGPSDTERLFTNCVLKTTNKTIYIQFRSVGFCTQNITNIPFQCIHICTVRSHDGKHSFWNRNSFMYMPLHIIRCTTSIIRTTFSAGPQELMCCSNNREWAWHNSRGDETVLQKSESSFLHSFLCGDLYPSTWHYIPGDFNRQYKALAVKWVCVCVWIGPNPIFCPLHLVLK